MSQHFVHQDPCGNRRVKRFGDPRHWNAHEVVALPPDELSEPFALGTNDKREVAIEIRLLALRS